MTLALFDLDNTLLAGDSDHSWGEFLIHKGIVDAEAYGKANDAFFEDYKNGTLDIVAYQEFALTALIPLDSSQRKQLHNEFMAQVITPMMQPKAVKLIEKHRQQGDTLVIITATNSFVTGPIATALGIDTLLATEPEIVDNMFTGKIVGVPCFQEGKIVKLNEWLSTTGHSLDGAWFYSDSANDLPLLERVANPVAVDPDERLLKHATEQQWPVISLRD